MKPSDDLRRDVYTGKDAQTVAQISKECGLSRSTVQYYSAQMVKAGRWKRVYLKSPRGFVSAYVKIK